MNDLYKRLGLEIGASPREIKRAYRKLALRYHPDRNPHDPTAREKFLRIQEAYEVLADPKKRAAYLRSERRSKTKPSETYSKTQEARNGTRSGTAYGKRPEQTRASRESDVSNAPGVFEYSVFVLSYICLWIGLISRNSWDNAPLMAMPILSHALLFGGAILGLSMRGELVKVGNRGFLLGMLIIAFSLLPFVAVSPADYLWITGLSGSFWGAIFFVANFRGKIIKFKTNESRPRPRLSKWGYFWIFVIIGLGTAGANFYGLSVEDGEFLIVALFIPEFIAGAVASYLYLRYIGSVKVLLFASAAILLTLVLGYINNILLDMILPAPKNKSGTMVAYLLWQAGLHITFWSGAIGIYQEW